MRFPIALGLIITGVILIGSSLWPGLTYSVSRFTSPPINLIDPTDVTLAGSWFSKKPILPHPSATTITHFTFSYKKINLTDISVTVNGSDLKKGAIHFPGTSLPGDYGNSVIIGHSALPQFYKSGSPLTLFNPLLKAKIGDDIFVNFDGIIYHYLVRKTAEVDPSQIEVLFQDFSRKELTLITCTPLGTYWRRFVVRAELVI
jgi:sortase A